MLRNAFSSAMQPEQTKPQPQAHLSPPLPGYQACTQTNSFDIVMHSCAAARPGLACSVWVCVDTFVADCRQLKAAIKVNCRQVGEQAGGLQEAVQLIAIN